MFKTITKKYIGAGLLIGALALTVGCGSNEQGKSTKVASIKVGATAGPHADVVQAAAKEAAKNGLKVEVIEFSDYITPDKALNDGELDLNCYQHEPFLQNFNKNNKGTLVPIGKAILMRMGIYSDKFKDVKDIADGATIAIPNDPTNGGRGLLLLERAGLLKLKKGVGLKATVKDIVDNPKDLKIVELEAAQLPRSLKDVDGAAITMNYVMSGGLDVKKQNVFLEPKDEPLAVMIIAARAKDKDKPAYKEFVKAYQSPGVKQYIADKFKGTIEPAF